MQKRSAGLLATALLLAGSDLQVCPGVAQANKEASSMPKVGDVAPDFTLKYLRWKGFEGREAK